MERRWKIGIDARMFSDSFTGIGRYNYELTKRFFEISLTSEVFRDTQWVIFMNEPEYSQFEFLPQVRKVCVNAPHYSFAEQWKFWRILQQEKCDLVHFTHFNAPLLYRGKFVTTIHDTTISFYPGKKMNSWWRKLGYRKVIGHAIGGAEKVITVSENTKKDVVELFGADPEKIQPILLAPSNEFQDFSDIEKMAIRDKFGLSDQFLLYTGNWREHKNLPSLLEAFRMILDRSKEANGPSKLQKLQLVITGKEDPFYPEVLQTIEKLDLQESVKLVGLVDFDDLVRLYNTATVCVVPSLYEGFGLQPLEAMKSLTPVAVSHVSSLPEVCGDAVVYFDPKDVPDMAQNLLKLLTDEDLQQELVEKGKERVKQFSWDGTARRTLEVYEGVLSM